ncbi:MAG: hypothetical protein JKY19_11920 [Alcanivoracaceae bacterium]|nr:hypothetical protein [Alcanivoracaceae bacterium]
MRYKLGTRKWVKHNNGKLAFRDRMVLIYQGVLAKAKTKKDLKSGKKVHYMAVDEILPPDSPICLEAMALSEISSKPYLFNHCMRAYFWARLLNDGEIFDDEATFTAIMLHDLGLTDKYRLTGDQQQCFTLPAANIAENMALKHQWSDKRAAIVADAITLHLNVTVDAKHGREAELVRIGSGADVAGLGLNLLQVDQVEKVVKKLPRLNFKQQIIKDLSIEITERPCCRISFLYKKLNFGDYIQNARFSE